VLADVTGSATLVWRFRAERRQPGQSQAAEARAAIVVAAALAIVSALITIQAVIAIATGSRPGTSGVTLTAAAVSQVVLTPLAYAKRRLGAQMSSRALQGDGTLSGIGAATSLLALTALALCRTLGWRWADRAAALIVAAIVTTDARHTAPHRQPPYERHVQPPPRSPQAAAGWQAQPHDRPAHARRPSATAQPAIPSATTPSSHQAPIRCWRPAQRTPPSLDRRTAGSVFPPRRWLTIPTGHRSVA